jgi:hypothetical protein
MQNRLPALFQRTAVTKQKPRRQLNPSSKHSPRRRNPQNPLSSLAHSQQLEEVLLADAPAAAVVDAAAVDAAVSRPSLLPSLPQLRKASSPICLRR